jgi:hypothetical protein
LLLLAPLLVLLVALLLLAALLILLVALLLLAALLVLLVALLLLLLAAWVVLCHVVSPSVCGPADFAAPSHCRLRGVDGMSDNRACAVVPGLRRAIRALYG